MLFLVEQVLKYVPQRECKLISGRRTKQLCQPTRPQTITAMMTWASLMTPCRCLFLPPAPAHPFRSMSLSDPPQPLTFRRNPSRPAPLGPRVHDQSPRICGPCPTISEHLPSARTTLPTSAVHLQLQSVR